MAILEKPATLLGQASSAAVALTARRAHAPRDAIAAGESCSCNIDDARAGSKSHNRARDLMAKDRRQRMRSATAGRVQITATHRTGLDPHENLSRPERRHGNIAEFEWTAGCHEERDACGRYRWFPRVRHQEASGSRSSSAGLCTTLAVSMPGRRRSSAALMKN